jgi:hypothetical protein
MASVNKNSNHHGQGNRVTVARCGRYTQSLMAYTVVWTAIWAVHALKKRRMVMLHKFGKLIQVEFKGTQQQKTRVCEAVSIRSCFGIWTESIDRPSNLSYTSPFVRRYVCITVNLSRPSSLSNCSIHCLLGVSKLDLGDSSKNLKLTLDELLQFTCQKRYFFPAELQHVLKLYPPRAQACR